MKIITNRFDVELFDDHYTDEDIDSLNAMGFIWSIVAVTLCTIAKIMGII